MKDGKKSLILGVIIGIVLAFFYFQFFAPRYEIKNMAASTIKVDRWTGQSWRLVDNNWKKMAVMDEKWEMVDMALKEALQNALKIRFVESDTDEALQRLREKHPVLNEISDNELFERIEIVYSKLMLANSYLYDFMRMDSGSEERESALFDE